MNDKSKEENEGRKGKRSKERKRIIKEKPTTRRSNKLRMKKNTVAEIKLEEGTVHENRKRGRSTRPVSRQTTPFQDPQPVLLKVIEPSSESEGENDSRSMSDEISFDSE